MSDYNEFNKKLCGMPDRKGSVADYWLSLDRKVLVNLMIEQCYFSDSFMERGDKLERKVNDVCRENRELKKQLNQSLTEDKQ